MASITTIIEEKNQHPTQIESQLIMEFGSINSDLTVRSYPTKWFLDSNERVKICKFDGMVKIINKVGCTDFTKTTISHFIP